MPGDGSVRFRGTGVASGYLQLAPCFMQLAQDEVPLPLLSHLIFDLLQRRHAMAWFFLGSVIVVDFVFKGHSDLPTAWVAA